MITDLTEKECIAQEKFDIEAETRFFKVVQLFLKEVYQLEKGCSEKTKLRNWYKRMMILKMITDLH